jgi:hypothetical protein
VDELFYIFGVPKEVKSINFGFPLLGSLENRSFDFSFWAMA